MKDKKKFWLIFSVAAVVLFVWMIRYKAINQDYRQRWSANTEKTYSVGEIVPIAPDFVGYNLAAEGYGIPFKAIHITDKESAQNVPAPVTTYALFRDGQFLTQSIQSDKKFLALAGL